MLFSTVYGPELESLYRYIKKYTQLQKGVSCEQIYSLYLPAKVESKPGQTKNIEDALGFLYSAGLVAGDRTCYYVPIMDTADLDITISSSLSQPELSFPLILLLQFKKMQEASHVLPPLDLLYVTLLEQLFIKPDQIWISDVHSAVNKLSLANTVGGVSQEKVNAWKRVMEFLGLGYRASGGFYCLYQPQLLYSLGRLWRTSKGPLQPFLEDHLALWMPCLSERGDIATSLKHPFEWLERKGRLTLFSQQDFPFRAYFGNRRVKGIELL